MDTQTLFHRSLAMRALPNTVFPFPLNAQEDWTLERKDVEGDGRVLFDQIVAMDLEGIVCKRKDSPYKVTEKPSRYWIKVKNSRYSHLEGGETV